MRFEDVVRKLVGQPLLQVRSIVSLYIFDFGNGKVIETTDLVGNKCMVSEFAVHTESSWRLQDDHRIIVTRDDRFFWAEGRKRPQFDWRACRKKGKNLCDVQLAKIFRSLPCRAFTVSKVESDTYGGLTISFKGGFALIVWPDNSFAMEAWRFIDSRSDTHYVCEVPRKKKEDW